MGGSSLIVWLRYLLVLFCTCAASVAWAQTNTATITGAERLVVRRGPGKQFAPLASLGRGSKVEVEEIEGEWARIITGSGQRGYVHSNFLSLAGEGTPGPAAGPPVAGSTTENELQAANQRRQVLEGELRSATERAAALEAEVKAVTEQNATLSSEAALLNVRSQALETELEGVKKELAGWRERAEAAEARAGAVTETIDDAFRDEVARLAAAAEALQSRLGPPRAAPATSSSAPENAADEAGLLSAGGILLGLLGIMVGWVLSGTWGRKADRGRRPRIRF